MRDAGTGCLVDRRQCLFGPGADGNVLSQIDPSDRPLGIDVKLGWTRNVIAFGSGSPVKHVVTLDDGGVGVGQERERVTHFHAMGFRYVDWVDADGCDLDATRLKFTQMLLKTPQLGVTERSPVPTIKNQHRAVGRQ
jgi:hypothetical protein